MKKKEDAWICDIRLPAQLYSDLTYIVVLSAFKVTKDVDRKLPLADICFFL